MAIRAVPDLEQGFVDETRVIVSVVAFERRTYASPPDLREPALSTDTQGPHAGYTSHPPAILSLWRS